MADDAMPSLRHRMPKWFLLLSPILSLIGLHKFTTAFFLAKKSLPHTSSCRGDSASNLLSNVLGVEEHLIQKIGDLGIISKEGDDGEDLEGCWMPRRVDAMAVIVVDALRFDFAVEHLPKSVGARLKAEQNRRERRLKDADIGVQSSNDTMALGQSQLYQFVADPPTVTMQRLKGLTTGGLPTFADISGSFGGAVVDEDSWVQQMRNIPLSKRGRHKSGSGGGKDQHTNMAFVGDDTWIDLFPTQFDDSHPYPSFNTRDLDTVDDGCMLHLPRLLKAFGSPQEVSNRTASDGETYFELIVAHFLGVDHVGHTYGPHNSHMDKKLNQMDDALQTIFGKIDEAKDTCQLAFVFGDHGMTEDGNHGGGTDEETHAALFVHFSPGCGDLEPSLSIAGSEAGTDSEEAFQSVNQIDLVPTISLLMGLPIPYANLGGVIPALLPPLYHKKNRADLELVEAPFAATALALNSAQVWNYLTTYSNTANKLPDQKLLNLKSLLDEAAGRYRRALNEKDGYDSVVYREACGLFKYFLSSATALGKQVWTRFDILGMSTGISILMLSLGVQIYLISYLPHPAMSDNFPSKHVAKVQSKAFAIESLVLIAFLIFHCILLTFSNSYIVSEQSIIMFMLSTICFITTISRHYIDRRKGILSHVSTPILVAFCSRINEILVTGHGMDPMIRKHWAHNNFVFLASLGLLVSMRILYYQRRTTLFGRTNAVLDMTVMACLAISWIEKRSVEVERHGYLSSRFALVTCIVGFCFALLEMYTSSTKKGVESSKKSSIMIFHESNVIFLKVLLFIVTVTGPSAASSSILFIIQSWGLYHLSNSKIHAPMLAMIWRLCIRHAFFATGHACSFNRLHFSAAFVAFEKFHFATAGVSLFLNTFGWEVLGMCFLANTCRVSNRQDVMSWYCFYQMVETFVSCVSVSILRRHLMVWAIFAPRFVFSAIYLLICSAYTTIHIASSRQDAKRQDHKHDQ